MQLSCSRILLYFLEAEGPWEENKIDKPWRSYSHRQLPSEIKCQSSATYCLVLCGLCVLYYYNPIKRYPPTFQSRNFNRLAVYFKCFHGDSKVKLISTNWISKLENMIHLTEGNFYQLSSLMSALELYYMMAVKFWLALCTLN